MVYKYRVTLTGIKGFYRVYEVNGCNSLYSFYKQMRDDMEFPQDQMILFKAMDSVDIVTARYSLVDLGAGTVDEVSMAKTVKDGIKSFVFFYDVTNKKSVNITLEGEAEDSKALLPTLVDVKGPNPIEFENGYVAFEDLPDEQRHLPSESDKPKKTGLAALLDALESGEDADDEDMSDDDVDDEDDEDDDEKDYSEDGKEIFDGSEDLTL